MAYQAKQKGLPLGAVPNERELAGQVVEGLFIDVVEVAVPVKV